MAFVEGPLVQRGQKRSRADTETEEPHRVGPSIQGIRKEDQQASDSDQLFDIFAKRDKYWTIFDTVASFLPIGDILALQRTCKVVAPIYEQLQKSQWNIDKRLERFFKDPRKFREKIGESEALVSGSFALQFFGKNIISQIKTCLLVAVKAWIYLHLEQVLAENESLNP
jgi:hypothetical protein